MSDPAAPGPRRALVTDASRGIGRAIAAALATRDLDVAGVGRDARTLADTIELIRSATRSAARPPVARAIVADLTVPDDVRRALDEAESALGPLDVVVHAAGTGGFRPLASLTPEDWLATRATNLDALVYVLSIAAARMLARGRGDIVTNLSVAATHTFPGAAAYCAGKAGALAYAELVPGLVIFSGVFDLVPLVVDSGLTLLGCRGAAMDREWLDLLAGRLVRNRYQDRCQLANPVRLCSPNLRLRRLDS